MAGVAPVSPKRQFVDAIGRPLAGGYVDVYLAGTTTRTNTWQDRGMTALNQNPIHLDARGECLMWLDPALTYKWVVKNAAGVSQYTADDLVGAAGGVIDATLRPDLAATGGAARIGYDGLTAQDVFDSARPMWDYTALGNYTGRATSIRITKQGIAGYFTRDDADTTSAANGGTVILDALGRRWKRLTDGSRVKTNWFTGGTGAFGLGNYAAALQAAIDATPTGGTLELTGAYRCSSGLVVTRTMTWEGADHRVGNVPDPANSRSTLFFDATMPIAVSVLGAILTLDGVVIAGSLGTGTGVKARNVNNSVLLVGGSVVQGFEIGADLKDGYYNKIDNATITFCKTPLICDNIYDLPANALTIRADGAASQGIVLLNGSQLTMTGGSIENCLVLGVGAYNGSTAVLLGTYFENMGGANVIAGTNASVTAIGCRVYLTTGANKFISVEGGSTTGVRIYSRHNTLVYPADATSVVAYSLNSDDPTADIDIAGDNWPVDSLNPALGAGTVYVGGGFFGGTGPTSLCGNIRIVWPVRHANFGKNINTIPWAAKPANTAVPGTPDVGMMVNYGCNGFAGDDPLNIRLTAWGANPYSAIYQKGQWEKVGIRLPNQADSAAGTVADLAADFNSLLAKLRANGVMV